MSERDADGCWDEIAQPKTNGAEAAALPEKRTYTLMEVAELLGMSKNAIYAAAKANALPVPVIRIGKKIMVSRAAFHRALGMPDA